jgi:hypothetical protein
VIYASEFEGRSMITNELGIVGRQKCDANALAENAVAQKRRRDKTLAPWRIPSRFALQCAIDERGGL